MTRLPAAAARRQPARRHRTVLRSRYLLSIAAFVVLLASVSTFLYFEQARLVELHFPDRIDQTRVFGTLDFIVQSLALLTQLFLTGRIVQRLGIVVLLTTVPVVMTLGFSVARAGADLRGVRGGDGHSSCRRIRTGATGPRNAVHRGYVRGEVQGKNVIDTASIVVRTLSAAG